MRALLLATVALWSGACASLPPAPVPPAPPHSIQIGLNDGYHGVLPPEIFAADCPTMIRTPQTSGAALGAFLSAMPAGCTALALVEWPDWRLAEDFAHERPAAIELGNELELGPYEYSPAKYAQWIRNAATVIKAADYRGDVILGGVYAVRPETKDAIRLGIAACIDAGLTCKVGVHLYDASDEDLAWLRSLNWPIWVTEIGYPTRCSASRVLEQEAWLAQQIHRFASVPGIERVFLYQRADGRGCTDLDTFGVEKKPAFDLLHR